MQKVLDNSFTSNEHAATFLLNDFARAIKPLIIVIQCNVIVIIQVIVKQHNNLPDPVAVTSG